MAIGDPLLERLPVDPLHGDIGPLPLSGDTMHGGHAGVGQSCGGAGFLHKTLHDRVDIRRRELSEERGLDDLDGDHPTQLDILGPVHGSHAAFPDHRDNLVGESGGRPGWREGDRIGCVCTRQVHRSSL